MLLRLGLDGSLHPALGDVRVDGAGPAHGSPVARPVHHGVRLLRAPKQAKGAVRALHAKRKLLLQGRQWRRRVEAPRLTVPRCVHSGWHHDMSAYY